MNSQFKIGDKIIAVKGTLAYDRYKDTIIIVDKPCTISTYDRVCYIDPITNDHNGWLSNMFKFYNNKSKTEIDVLDSIQLNFKEGY